MTERLLARAFGAFESLVALTVAVGALVTPLVIDVIGIRGALVALGLVAPALVALGWRRLRAIDASIERRDDEIDVINRISMFRPLPIPAIDSLAHHVRQAQIAAGQEVFHQGEDGECYYVIRDGEAEVIGDGRLVRTMGPGDGFGEIAHAATSSPRSAAMGRASERRTR